MTHAAGDRRDRYERLPRTARLALVPVFCVVGLALEVADLVAVIRQLRAGADDADEYIAQRARDLGL